MTARTPEPTPPPARRRPRPRADRRVRRPHRRAGPAGRAHLGSTAVPITFQTLGVMLAGGILGARKGFLAVLLLEVLVAAGLPLLSGGRGGIGVFFGPTAGYLLGWLLGVVVIGWFTARLLPRYRAPACARRHRARRHRRDLRHRRPMGRGLDRHPALGGVHRVARVPPRRHPEGRRDRARREAGAPRVARTHRAEAVAVAAIPDRP